MTSFVFVVVGGRGRVFVLVVAIVSRKNIYKLEKFHLISRQIVSIVQTQCPANEKQVSHMLIRQVSHLFHIHTLLYTMYIIVSTNDCFAKLMFP